MPESPPSTSLSVGFVGCGGFVRGNHLPNIARIPGFRIRALCDLDAALLAKIAATYRPDYTTSDYRRVFADPEIRVVISGTGPNFRLPLIEAAAASGKALFVEKPMSLGWEDTRRILEILAVRPVPVMVGMNRRYSEIMRETKRIFDARRLGPTLINYRIVGEDLLWPEFHREQLRRGASTLVHEIVHIFDLLNWLVGERPDSIYAVGPPSDNHILVLTWPGDARAAITSGGCGTEGFPKECLEIFTNNTAIRAQDFVELNVAQAPGERDRLFPLKSNPRGPCEGYTEARLREDLRAWRAQLTQEQIAVGYYYDSRVCVDKGHFAEMLCLHECLSRAQPIPTDAICGAEAVFLALKAQESLETGLPIRLDWTRLMPFSSSARRFLERSREPLLAGAA